MSNDGGQECLETCKQGVNSNECIQWRCNNFKEMLQGFNFIDSQLEYSKNIIINSQNCIAENISFVEYNERDIIEINLASKLSSGIINENVCALTNLEVLNISNNNLKGNNTVYGQLPGCLKELSNLKLIDISNNKFRGRIPFIGPQIKICEILNNNLCLFHEDKIPKICLDDPSTNELKLNETEYRRGDNVYFRLCENIFVDKNQNITSRIFNNRKNTNITTRILIYSGIFPLCSLVITTAVTIYGRIKSKFNKKDPNITTFSASISRLPNNFGNISNNNRHSLLTKSDLYNRPAPRPDNENSSLFNDQKRISSNPSNSFANTSLSSNTPSSPVISPNEIKNSNYRVIGSHYSLTMNPNQAIRFKNTLSMIQNNRNYITTSGTDTNNTPTSTISTQHLLKDKSGITNMNKKSTPAVSQGESSNQDMNKALSNVDDKNNGNPTPSKAKENLDQLLSSPQAKYYQINKNEHKREMSSPLLNSGPNSPQRVMSPLKSQKTYTPMQGMSSPNIYAKSPILSKSPVLMNKVNYSITKLPPSPSMSIPQLMSSQHQNLKISSPNINKINPQLGNRHSPNFTKKPRVRRVVYSFIADLPDEVPLIPGDEVIIHKVFDDGYAFGENISTGKFGVFPITSFHPDDQDISLEEMESSPSLNDIPFSQLSAGNIKSPSMTSPIITKPNSPSKFNNINNQDMTPTLMINKENIPGNTSSEPYLNSVNINNLYPINISQNSNSQNSNSQNSFTDEDDIDSLRRQSKIGYSAYMDQQKQKLMKKQAKQQARKNRLNSPSEDSFNGNERESYNKPLSPINISNNKLLNENVNKRIFEETQNTQYSSSQPSQFSQHSVNEIANSSFNSLSNSPLISNYKGILNKGINSESPSSIELQRMEDRRNKQIKLLNERLNKKDIGPEEKRYYLQLLQQLTN